MASVQIATQEILDRRRHLYLQDANANVKRLQSLQDDALLFLASVAPMAIGGSSSVDRARLQLGTLRSVDERLTGLQKDYASVLLLSMMSAAQHAADQQSELERAYGLPMDPLLVANQTRRAQTSDGGEMVVILSSTADNAARRSAERVYRDGLMLPDRLRRLDDRTRIIVADAITRGIAVGTPAEELGRQLRGLLTQAGVETPLYAAQRLAITEINNAYRRGTIDAARGNQPNGLKAGIVGLRWNLSLAHSVADECDDHAAASSPGLPSGVYLPDDVPDEHPNGMCYLTPEFAGASV